MDPQVIASVSALVKSFKLPLYHEIPDVGLYLEQTAKYISDCLAPVQDLPVTGSMISNYVKKGLIAKPVRKQYSREQIAQLMFIAVAKMVLSMDDVHLMLTVQRQTYPSQIAYDYFRTQLHLVLNCVFSGESELSALAAGATDQKVMLRNTIIALAHKIYLDKLFAMIREDLIQPNESK
jgi:DNA-binding transcriptional MerR regulator